MAAGILPKPGTKVGPCAKSCKHIDCAETRTMAARVCPICEKPIGYDTRFYQHGTLEELTHAVCLEDEVDREARNDSGV